MISQFDKTTLAQLRADLNDAIAALALKHAISLRVGHISYTDRTCTVKVEAGVANPENGRIATKEEEAFKQLAVVYGLKAEDLGRVVSLKGIRYTLVGLKPRASTRPIVLQDAMGRRIVASSQLIKGALETSR